MNKALATATMLTAAFCLGFAVQPLTTTNNSHMKRVTGIGGIFFKSKDPEKITEWYRQHLGLEANPYGALFEWYEDPGGAVKARTQWTAFPADSKYFDQDFMINYRVDDLEALVAELEKDGVTIVGEMETYDFGKFIHILDGDGNKVELWEPAK